MTTEDIPLICGNPGMVDGASGSPATFSMFALPFAYRGELREEERGTGPRFVPETIGKEDHRWKYFTVESAKSLFEQARHYVLDEIRRCDRGFTFSRGGRCLSIHLAPPRLVLFPGRQDSSEADPLRIGFLIVMLYFTAPSDEPVYLDDLLALNELYRYCREPYPGHREHGYKYALEKDIAGLKDIYAGRWLRWLRNAPGLHVEADDLTACGDNRAFVWTCAVLNKGSTTVRESFASTGDTATAFKDFELSCWIKLLNVDKPGGTALLGNDYEREWAKKRTYVRWEAYGSLYGIHFHGGAMMGPPNAELHLWRHFMGIYFDQTLLLLYLRIALFQFSERLSAISSTAYKSGRILPNFHNSEIDITEEEKKQQWRREFQELRWSFALFSNVYGFPLLSNQQQGIELYTLAREHMDVRELFEQVRQSIHDSHEYLQVESESKQTETTTRLTVVASIGLAFSVAAGILGMNMFDKENLQGLGTGIIIFFVLLGVCLRGLDVVAKNYSKLMRHLDTE